MITYCNLSRIGVHRGQNETLICPTGDPDMTTNRETETASAVYADRGALCFAVMTQDAKHPAKLALRKWLSANGVPSTYAARLSFAELENAWNDTSDASLNILRLSQGTASAAQSAASNGTNATTSTKEETFAMNTNENAASDVATAAALLAEALAKSQGSAPMDRRAVASIIADEMDALLAQLPDMIAQHSPVKTIEIKQHDGSTYKVEGRAHPKFETLLKVAASRTLCFPALLAAARHMLLSSWPRRLVWSFTLTALSQWTIS
jgi:hypothetical protein